MNLHDAHQEGPLEYVRSNRRAILIDIGGVLVPDHLTAAAIEWSARLGIPPQGFLDALFGGNDDHVLIGRTSEESWWNVVRDRLGLGPDLISEIRNDLASRETWDGALLEGLRHLRGRVKIAVVSNAWPHMRNRMANAGLLEIVDLVVLSCEIGVAKPDPHIYTAALRGVGARPAEALFIDDTPGHVAAASSLGISGHVHTSTADTLARIQKFLDLDA
ncbi:HAD family phosphatase [Streptomyces noursei]|uniref:HAD family hydrolase n=1 Tax=Streptomyces noursei TaxID=1971 RepID=UPI00081C47D1|nr:haloacid dehalogenase superfamily protein, subfamily IA [Streptomyces noursei ATCC 11455]MCZ0996716.1 HAD family phosphatase [Streptomyces noursei]